MERARHHYVGSAEKREKRKEQRERSKENERERESGE